MKTRYIILPLLCLWTAVAAQEAIPPHNHEEDSTDVFYRHLQLGEITVTGVTGDTKLKHSTAPVGIVTPQMLRSTSSTNIIDAIAHQPGISQLTTGSGISKPIIRGLGYNRVVVISEGIRQEGQQWGDEHGVEVDAGSVGSVEILKGPASLMYGSDAMAGVVILHAQPTLSEGETHAQAGAEYQTNNGLFSHNYSFSGNRQGFVWDARYSGKTAHAYRNPYDGYMPGSQFHERAGRLMLGLNKYWGFSRLTATAYHLTPGIVEGERDETTGALVPGDASPTSYLPFSITLSPSDAFLPFQQVKHYKMVWDNALNLSSGSLKAIVGYQQNHRQEFEESADDYELYFKTHTLTYDLRYVTQEWNDWKFSTGVGGMYQQSTNEGEEQLIPNYRLLDIGAYATATKTFNDSWTLNSGIRYDRRHLRSDALEEEGTMRFTDFTRHFDGLTGSMGAVCNVNEHLNLRLNIARGFRTPNISELASNGIHEGSIRYEIGSQQLKAEYSWQADFGLDFTSRYVSFQLALFANRIDNYIYTHRLPQVVEEDYLTYAYTQGDARLLGFEVGIDIHPIHSVHFGNTFSYVDAQLMHQPASTRYLPFTPAPHWASELKWELTHHSHTTFGQHSHPVIPAAFSLNNLYAAAGLDHFFKQTHIYSADDTETVTPAYTLLDVSAGADVLVRGKKVAEIHILADNLFDCAYQSHLSRLKYAPVNVVTGRRGVYNMGRNVTFKVVIPIEF